VLLDAEPETLQDAQFMGTSDYKITRDLPNFTDVVYYPQKRPTGDDMGGDLPKLLCTSDVIGGRVAEAYVDSFWEKGELPEPKAHRIHPYPAKFPAFLATKAFSYARGQGLNITRVGDIFCGCGTVALEARREGVGFWGCDINPVATLIAKAKSSNYLPSRLRAYANQIADAYSRVSSEIDFPKAAYQRLMYGYQPAQYEELCRLLNAIRVTLPLRSSYLPLFLCAFSAILKPTSQWHPRAIKPQLDPNKTPARPMTAFFAQCELMASAWQEHNDLQRTHQEIYTENVLTVAPPIGGLDMIVTSPPYVTSYEYADLHQLSAIWLGFADDYRTLRDGSIGSTQHTLNFNREFKNLNEIGTKTVFALYTRDRSAAHSVAKYYLDMQHAALRCHAFLRPKGIGFFVIGNTRYKGVHVDNAAHLTYALLHAGFSSVKLTKRRIINKSHTPYRRDDGRFSRSWTTNQTYAEEYILLAHK
jgi:methylase of polypeptide subunit release factors